MLAAGFGLPRGRNREIGFIFQSQAGGQPSGAPGGGV